MRTTTTTKCSLLIDKGHSVSHLLERNVTLTDCLCCRCARVRRSHLDQSVLNTPCVMGALEELQLAQDIGLPDMLALIGQSQHVSFVCP